MNKIILLAGSCLWLLGCSILLDPDRRADPRTARPPPQLFDRASQSLPGKTIIDAEESEGIWHFSTIEQHARMEHGVEPLLYYALFLKLDADNRYELVYQAYWGSRNLSDARINAVDVRETGRFFLSAGTLVLEPDSTAFTEKKAGRLTKQTITNENRTYLAALDGAYLNIAGRCAQYQVEPICRHPRDVWYSLRFGVTQWPVPSLQ